MSQKALYQMSGRHPDILAFNERVSQLLKDGEELKKRMQSEADATAPSVHSKYVVKSMAEDAHLDAAIKKFDPIRVTEERDVTKLGEHYSYYGCVSNVRSDEMRVSLVYYYLDGMVHSTGGGFCLLSNPETGKALGGAGGKTAPCSELEWAAIKSGNIPKKWL